MAVEAMKGPDLMGKHDKTRKAIDATPTRVNIKWAAVVALLEHEGAIVTPIGGSMFSVVLGDRSAVFHRPHPGDECQAALVKRIREFLAGDEETEA